MVGPPGRTRSQTRLASLAEPSGPKSTCSVSLAASSDQKSKSKRTCPVRRQDPRVKKSSCSVSLAASSDQKSSCLVSLAAASGQKSRSNESLSLQRRSTQKWCEQNGRVTFSQKIDPEKEKRRKLIGEREEKEAKRKLLRSKTKTSTKDDEPSRKQSQAEIRNSNRVND